MNLPHNWETERALIGAALISADAFAEARGIVQARHFAKPAHAALWARLCDETDARHAHIDIVTLIDVVGDASGSLERYGGPSYVLALPQACSTIDGAATYARRIVDHATRRALMGALQDSMESLRDPTSNPMHIAATMGELAREAAPDDGWRPLAEGTRMALERAATASDTGTPPEFLSTGIAELDDKLKVERGDLVIVGARPSMGKSAFMQQVATHAARYHGATGFLALEMRIEQLGMRALASCSGVPMGRIREGVSLTHGDRRDLERADSDMVALPVYIDDRSSLTPQMMVAKVAKLKRQRPDLCAVFLDYLQLTEDDGDNRNASLSILTRQAKLMAKDLDVAVYLASQLNRTLEQRTDKRPINSDLRDSGAIEQDADVILMLYRDEVYTGLASQDRGMAEIIIRKQRQGEQATIRVPFHGAYSRFGDAKADARVYQFPGAGR